MIQYAPRQTSKRPGQLCTGSPWPSENKKASARIANSVKGDKCPLIFKTTNLKLRENSD